MEADEEGVGELVAAAGEDICEFVADEARTDSYSAGNGWFPKT